MPPSDRVEAARAILTQKGGPVGHCSQVSKLAGKLFEQTRELHGLGAEEHELLMAGAMLHDIGVTVDYQGHHKHSRDIISHLKLPGFDSRERSIIACLARYHRKAAPSDEHEEFAALSSADREVVRKLAALLRIADGLDRSHTDAVRSLAARAEPGGRWVIEVTGRGDLSAELWAARDKKSDLFQEVYGVTLEIREV